MKKIIFILMAITSIVFASCNAPTEIKVVEFSTGKSEFGATFTDFFTKDNISTAIVMDKNTGVLYVQKASGYQWGMSPIYDSDGSVLTKEKWLAKRAEKKE